MSDPTTLLYRDFLEAQERTALTPVEILRMADMEPDPWQTEVLGYQGDRLLLNCSRQSGKSTVAAAKSVGMLTAKPGAQVLMTAPSQRQSGELFRAASNLVVASGMEMNPEAWNKSTIELPDGGRIMAVPGTEQTIRGIPALDLLVIDEASRVFDELMVAVRPMIATTGGTIMALSTPAGQKGWFFEAAEGGSRGRWAYWKITADMCPRIKQDHLDEALEEMGQALFEQEYFCRFLLGDRQVFSLGAIDSVVRGAEEREEALGWKL